MKKLLLLIALFPSLLLAQDVRVIKNASGTIYTQTPANVRDTLFSSYGVGVNGYILQWSSARGKAVFINPTSIFGYVPENVANKTTDLTSPNNTKYPTSLAVSTALGGYQPLSTRTTVGNSFYTLANPSAITFPRINADNTVTARTAAQVLSDIGAAPATGSTAYLPINNPTATGTLTAPNITWSGGTATRVPYLGSGGAFANSADLIFDATNRILKVGTSMGASPTTTPATLDMGSSYATSPISAQAKWKLYMDGTAINTYGIGISANQFNFFRPSGGGAGTYNWYVSDVEKMKLDANGNLTTAGLSGSGNVIVGANNTGLLGKITIGSGLSLSGGVLTATGGSSGTVTTPGMTAGRLVVANSASDIGTTTALTISGSDLSVTGGVTATTFNGALNGNASSATQWSGLSLLNTSATGAATAIYGYDAANSAARPFTPNAIKNTLQITLNDVAMNGNSTAQNITIGNLNAGSGVFSAGVSATTGTYTGAVGALSFSGAGTGLTGTAASLSIGGNAANSPLWNGQALINTTATGAPSEPFGWDAANSSYRRFTWAAFNAGQGLGSNAFTSTPYLPLSGGTLSGALIGTSMQSTAFRAYNATVGGYATLSLSNVGEVELNYPLKVTGDITATGNVTANSDSTLKKNIRRLINVSTSLRDIASYLYEWKDTDAHGLGLIAQEVQKYYPELVKTDEKGILSVNYQNFTSVLLQGWKELDDRITKLENK